MLKQFRRGITTAALVLGAFVLPGCGDDTTPPNQGPLTIVLTEEENGNGQTGQVGEPLPDELRVLVTRDEEPVEDVEVQWITTSGGSLNPGTSLTDASGIATTVWTLGPGEGSQSASARLVGAEGSPVPFTANALPEPAPPPPGGPPQAVRPVQ